MGQGLSDGYASRSKDENIRGRPYPELPVRRLAHEVVFTDGDTCGVEMLEPAVSALRLNFEEEGVLFTELSRRWRQPLPQSLSRRLRPVRSHRYVGFC